MQRCQTFAKWIMLPEIEKLTRKLSEVAQGQKDIHALCRGMVMDEVAKDSFDEIMMSDAFVAEKGDKNAALARYIDKRTKLYKAEFWKWEKEQNELRKQRAAEEAQRKQLRDAQRAKDEKREAAELKEAEERRLELIKREQQRKAAIEHEKVRPYHEADDASRYYLITATLIFFVCGHAAFGIPESIAKGSVILPVFVIAGVMLSLLLVSRSVAKGKEAKKEKTKLDVSDINAECNLDMSPEENVQYDSDKRGSSNFAYNRPKYQEEQDELTSPEAPNTESQTRLTRRILGGVCAGGGVVLILGVLMAFTDGKVFSPLALISIVGFVALISYELIRSGCLEMTAKGFARLATAWLGALFLVGQSIQLYNYLDQFDGPFVAALLVVLTVDTPISVYLPDLFVSLIGISALYLGFTGRAHLSSREAGVDRNTDATQSSNDYNISPPPSSSSLPRSQSKYKRYIASRLRNQLHGETP